MTEMSWHEKGRAVQETLFTHDGLTMNLTAWARRLDIHPTTLSVRLKTWRDQGLALTAPKGAHGKGR